MSTSPEHQDEIRQLFARSVPEIAAGEVEIVSVAREVGHRAYVAVRAPAAVIDPVGVCTGPNSRRIKAMVGELPGDHLTVIRWEEAPERFIKNCLRPLNVISVSIDPANHQAIVKCERSLEGARNRQSWQKDLGLISELVGWNIRLEDAPETPG